MGVESARDFGVPGRHGNLGLTHQGCPWDPGNDMELMGCTQGTRGVRGTLGSTDVGILGCPWGDKACP